MKILIIEDDQNTLNGLVELLLLEKHMAVGAENAATALKMLESNTFDLILCDVRLPDANGLSLCAHIHQNFADITMFIFTAYCNLQHREMAYSNGVSRLFSKPLDIDELMQALQSVPEKLGDSSYLN